MATNEDELLRRGFEALREKLGRADMARFIMRLRPGRGDWAKERHAWVDSMTLDEFVRLIERQRAFSFNGQKKATTGKPSRKPRKQKKVA